MSVSKDTSTKDTSSKDTSTLVVKTYCFMSVSNFDLCKHLEMNISLNADNILKSSLPHTGPRAPRVVLPDRALCLPTFCHLL